MPTANHRYPGYESDGTKAKQNDFWAHYGEQCYWNKLTLSFDLFSRKKTKSVFVAVFRVKHS